MPNEQDERGSSTHDAAVRTKANPDTAVEKGPAPAKAGDPVETDGKPTQIKPDGR